MEASRKLDNFEEDTHIEKHVENNSTTGIDTEVKEDEWVDVLGSGELMKKVLKPGLGFETRPNKGDQATVSIRYFINDKVFEENENLKFIVGDMDVILGLDLVICLMEKEESARVKVPAKFAYGKVGREPDVPPDSSIECEIELKDIEPVNEDSLSVSEGLKLGNGKRIRGNYFYERGEYLAAIQCYERAAEYLDSLRDCSGSSNAELQEVVDLRLKVYNNTAATHLKLSAYSAARKSVDSVLAIQPKNVKALFRKGKILSMLGETEDAISCLKTAAALEPDSKIIQVELTKLKNQHKKEEMKQKAMYQRMFPRSEPKKMNPLSQMKNWFITGGLLAVAAGTMVAYKQYYA
ncbi:peptidyl-prolyl cis-trans isomerase FKBP8-like [Uloborus diversus]|uniref:peptidyl-prolyl cis-trans isomerase FKBP8-like n=1 Tax=Uloborus diversus TaxID=327109 RepID=UPI0024098DB0|nr:peptidyl-prolyl cis-trans isomerase FKBP8-like [Uloborus diversus]